MRINRNAVSAFIDLYGHFESNFDAEGLRGELRLTLNGNSGTPWPVRPFAVLGGSAIRQDEIVESGNGVAALTIDSTVQEWIIAGAGLELYQTWDDGQWLMLRASGLDILWRGPEPLPQPIRARRAGHHKF